MYKKTIFVFCCLLSSLVTYSKEPNKRAMHLYNKALLYYSENKTELAIKTMNHAVKCDTAWDEPYSMLGKWYFETNRFSLSANVFSDASLYCRKGGKQFAKSLAKCLLYNAEPDKALIIINAYSSPTDTGEWGKMRKQAFFIEKSIKNQYTEMPNSLNSKINTLAPELFPLVTKDTNVLYFTRRDNNMDDELYKATMEDTCNEWKSIENLEEPLNTSNHESAQFISADGHYLFFARSDNRSENGWSNGDFDLFMSYKVRIDTDDWTIPQPFGATINTPYYEGMPSLSPDNRELYFVSDRPGGYGGLDIWISRFEDGRWQLPLNAGANINTAGNETAPNINADNYTLYFTSNGLPGMGGYDLFMSHKINDSTWRQSINLGFPINTACNEMSQCISTDGKYIYFASDRRGPAGNYDLFITPLPEHLRPLQVCYLQGSVYDSLTHEPLNYAQIFIIHATNGDTLYQFQSNRGDGTFMITLQAGTSYIRHTARMAYTDVEDTFTLDISNLKVPLTKNIAMLPFDYQEVKPITDSLIATIHFDPNRIELSDAEKKNIRMAIAPFLEEKGMVYYVNGYTDNTGTPLINEELSYKRANLVLKEMAEVGVNEVFIFAKGWGESKMIASNNTEEGRKTNRRVEIIVKRQ